MIETKMLTLDLKALRHEYDTVNEELRIHMPTAAVPTLTTEYVEHMHKRYGEVGGDAKVDEVLDLIDKKQMSDFVATRLR